MSKDTSTTYIQQIFQAALQRIEAHEEELGQLDAAAGDGDHGRTMVRGLRAAVVAISSTDTASASNDGPVGMVIMQAGTAFADAAGGASGPLLGMFMMNIGQKIGANEVDATLVHTAFDAGLNAILKLGKAKPGDKTMIDTLSPFVTALGDAANDGQSLADAWDTALAAAQTGAESTAEMMAKKGRASKLRERSIGHLDPGAMSMLYMLQATGSVLSSCV
ncbi:MAG: dihydroxyacetone kinase subunit DhaL [Chloroflexota bacterium]